MPKRVCLRMLIIVVRHICFVYLWSQAVVGSPVIQSQSTRSVEVHPFSLEYVVELNDIMERLQFTNRDSATVIRDMLYEISMEHSFYPALTNVFNFDGITEHFKSNYQGALAAYRQALVYAEQAENRDMIALIYANMAITFRELGLNELDIEYKRRAMQIFQELGNLQQVNMLNVMIALAIFQDTRNLSEAERFVRDAEEYYLTHDSEHINLVFLYNGLASYYQINKDFGAYLYKSNHFDEEKSAYYLEKALAIPASDFARSHVLATQSRFYLNAEAYDRAYEKGLEAIALFRLTGQRVYEGWMYLTMSEISMYRNKYSEALEYIRKTRDVFTELGLQEYMGNVILMESEIRQRMGEYSLALEQFKRGKAILDSMAAAVNLERLNSLRLFMEQDILLSEKQKAELERDFEKERASKELARRNLFVTTTGLIFLVAGLLGWRIREKEQHRKQLLSMNEKLSDSEQQLRALNVSKDRFFGILSHDLRSPLYAFESLCDRLFVPDVTRREEIISKMKDHSRKLRVLLNNVLLWSKSEQGLLKMNCKALLLHDSVEDAFGLYREEASLKGIDLLNLTDSESLVFADQDAFQTIIRNLINNALKHTDTGTVTVKSTELPDGVQIELTDTGRGIPADKLKEIFAFTGNIRSGLGLLLCKQLIEANKGTISISSEEHVGTTITLFVPKFTIA